mmetsp:Transcript_31762/g.62947  ORF Transcript_31762/g.62947 Transcript_31762/m.62947 type:complete len:86 (+) Transcript_31762:195-452(+)
MTPNTPGISRFFVISTSFLIFSEEKVIIYNEACYIQNLWEILLYPGVKCLQIHQQSTKSFLYQTLVNYGKLEIYGEASYIHMLDA